MTWRYRTEVDVETVNVHLAALEAAGLLGLVEEDGRTDAYFPARVDGLPLPGTWEAVPDVDWSSAWREGLEPVAVGRLRISPPWAAAPGDVVVDPGQAFGTGHHETTAACLGALQELDLGGRRVLDVGTGSGVLAICAARLGAVRVVALDNDPVARDAAVRNAAVNGVSVDVRLGSLDVVDERFDVVVANLDTATVTALADGLAGRLEPDSVLVVSGVSIERADEAVRALSRAGLDCTTRDGREWAVLVCRPGKHETPG